MEGIYTTGLPFVSAAVRGGDDAGAVTETIFVGETAVAYAVVEVPAGLVAALQITQGPAGAVTEAIFVGITAVAYTVVNVAAGLVAALQITQGPAGAVAKAAAVVVAAVGGQAVNVAAMGLAALQGTQGPAVVVTFAGRVRIATVNYTRVGVTAAECAVLIGADRDGSLDISGIPAVVSAPSAAMTTVGRDGRNHHGGHHEAQQTGKQTTLRPEHGNDFLSVRLWRVMASL